MSAFFVSESCIFGAVAAIRVAYEWGGPSRDSDIRELLALDDTGLAHALWSHNAEAVATRYSASISQAERGGMQAQIDALPADMNVIKFRPFADQRRVMVAAYKAAEALAYQCDESEALANRPESRALESTCQFMARSIVASLPEYDDAAWG